MLEKNNSAQESLVLNPAYNPRQNIGNKLMKSSKTGLD